MDATKREFVSMTQELGSQKLSKQEIEDFKLQNISKDELIDYIRKNNEQFELRSKFS